MTARRWSATLAASVTFVAATAAADKGPPRECTAAAETSQLFRNAGKLIDAKKELLQCVDAHCPKIIENDCAQWLAEVESRIPTVTVSAVGPDGNDVTDVALLVDGATVATKLDGHALPVDPGPHHFTFQHAGSPNVEENVTVKEGEKARAVRVQFTAAEAKPAAPRTQAASLVVPITLAAVGVVGIGGFLLYHFSAKSDLDDMRRTCAPSCTNHAVDTVDNKILVSHVALGVGITALVAAAFDYVYPRLTGQSTSTAAARHAWGTF